MIEQANQVVFQRIAREYARLILRLWDLWKGDNEPERDLILGLWSIILEKMMLCQCSKCRQRLNEMTHIVEQLEAGEQVTPDFLPQI